MEFISVAGGAENVGSQAAAFTSFEFNFESKAILLFLTDLSLIVPTLTKQETFDEVWERIERSGIFGAEKG